MLRALKPILHVHLHDYKAVDDGLKKHYFFATFHCHQLLLGGSPGWDSLQLAILLFKHVQEIILMNVEHEVFVDLIFLLFILYHEHVLVLQPVFTCMDRV